MMCQDIRRKAVFAAQNVASTPYPGLLVVLGNSRDFGQKNKLDSRLKFYKWVFGKETTITPSSPALFGDSIKKLEN